MRLSLLVVLLSGCEPRLIPLGVAGSDPLDAPEPSLFADHTAELDNLVLVGVGDHGASTFEHYAYCDVLPDLDLALCETGVAAYADGQTFGRVGDALAAGFATVNVCPGVHGLAPTTVQHPVVLRSASGTSEDTALRLSGSLVAAHPMMVQALGFEQSPTSALVGQDHLIVACSSMIGNRAEDGGAIRAHAEAQVLGSRFVANTAGYGGGAIHSMGDLVVDHSGFFDNVADYSGGAISDSMENRTVIKASAFVENRSGYEGGAVSMSGSGEISTSRFQDNVAEYEGGAVDFGSWEDERLSVLDSDFNGNRSRRGAAISVGSWANDEVWLQTVSFQDNEVFDPQLEDAAVVEFCSWGGFDAGFSSVEFSGVQAAVGMSGWLDDGYEFEPGDTRFNGPSGRW